MKKNFDFRKVTAAQKQNQDLNTITLGKQLLDNKFDQTISDFDTHYQTVVAKTLKLDSKKLGKPQRHVQQLQSLKEQSKSLNMTDYQIKTEKSPHNWDQNGQKEQIEENPNDKFLPADQRFISQNIKLKSNLSLVPKQFQSNLSALDQSMINSNSYYSLKQNAFMRRTQQAQTSGIKTFEVYNIPKSQYSRLMTAPTDKLSQRRPASHANKFRHFSMGPTNLNSQQYLKVQNLVNSSKGFTIENDNDLHQETTDQRIINIQKNSTGFNQQSDQIQSNAFQLMSINSLKDNIETSQRQRPYSSGIQTRVFNQKKNHQLISGSLNNSNHKKDFSSAQQQINLLNQRKLSVQNQTIQNHQRESSPFSSYNKNKMQTLNQTTSMFPMSAYTINTLDRNKRPKEPKSIKIQVIDSYYQSINNMEEVDEIRYRNDYQRLYNQILKIWKTTPSIPQSEMKQTKRFLEQEIYVKQNYSPFILQKMNSYILYLQKFIQISNKLQNLIDERESLLYRFNLRSLQSSLIDFERGHGSQMMLMMRKLTLGIIKTFRAYLSYLDSNNASQFSQNSNISCYLCKIQKNDTRMLSQTSVIMMRLSVFLIDFITFIPKDQQKILNEISMHRTQKHSFTLTEVAQFEKISQKLSQYDAQEIEKAMIFLMNHQCDQNIQKGNSDINVNIQENFSRVEHSNNSDMLSNQDSQHNNFNEEYENLQININQINQSKSHLTIGQQKQNNQQDDSKSKIQIKKKFFKFDWLKKTADEMLESGEIETFSYNDSQPYNLKEKLVDAYQKLKTIVDSEALNFEDQGSMTDANENSDIDIQNQASYREGISLFQQNKEDSSVYKLTTVQGVQNVKQNQISTMKIKESLKSMESNKESEYATGFEGLNLKNTPDQYSTIQDPVLATEMAQNVYGQSSKYLIQQQKLGHESIIEMPTENIQFNEESISDDHQYSEDQIIETIITTEKQMHRKFSRSYPKRVSLQQ
eukprot:403363914